MKGKLVRLGVAGLGLVAAGVVVPAGPANAEIYQFVGIRCGGETAPRCAWMNFDSDNNRVRAYGQLRDQTSGTDYVQVNVCLEEWPADDDLPIIGDPTLSCSGWHGANEVITSSSALHRCSDNRRYRAIVHWDWRHGTGHDTFASEFVNPNVC